MKVGTAGNTVSTDKRAPVYRGNDTDFYGFDDGLRKIPVALQQAISTGRRVTSGNFTSGPARSSYGESLKNSQLTLIQSEPATGLRRRNHRRQHFRDW